MKKEVVEKEGLQEKKQWRRNRTKNRKGKRGMKIKREVKKGRWL